MPSRNQHSGSPQIPGSALRKILGASAPVTVALLGSFWLCGCDTPANQSDRKVQADVAKAQVAMDRGDAAGAAEARKMLEATASASDAAPLTRAYAKSSLAQLEQNAASVTMRQIEDNGTTLRELIYEIGQFAQQVDASRAIAASYDKRDPKPATDAINAQIAAAQGGPANLVWFKQGDSSAPSLTAVTQTISQLQGQIAKQADQLKSLQDQRTQVLDEADQADKSSEISKGQQSVDDFKRGADLRKQAGDLTVQIEKNQAQTVPMQKDLEVAQGQQVVLQKLIKELQDESAALDTGWKAVQDALTAQVTLQKQIVAGDGESAPATAGGSTSILPATAGKSINEKAEAMAKLVQEIAQERSDALSNLNNAIQHYRDAATAGQEYFATLDQKIKEPANVQRPEMDAWKNLQAITGPANYRMHEGLAQRQLAELYVSQVALDNRRSELQDEVSKILGAANIAVPPAISDATLDDDKKNAATSATAAFDAAEKALTNLASPLTPEPLKNLAKVESILTDYGQVLLARAMGDASTASDKLAAAKTARDEATQDGLQLPPLPTEIAAPPTSATPSTPATPGATPPA